MAKGESPVEEIGPQVVIGLEASNVKRLRAIKLPIGPGVTRVAGRNKQGKSSTFDCVAMVLAGGKVIPDVPIRIGEDEAESSIETTDFVMTRKWVTGGDKNGVLKVRAKSGRKLLGSPQSLCSNIIGAGLGFDPSAIMRMSDKERLESIRAVSTIEVDVDKLDEQREAVFSERTDVNRRLKEAQGALAASPAEQGPVETETSVVDALAAVEAAREMARARGEIAQSVIYASSVEAAAMTEVAALRKRLADIEEQARKTKASREAAEAALAACPDPPDLAPLQAKLSSAEADNAAIRTRNARRVEQARLAAVAREKQAKADELTAELESIDKKKSDALKSAKFPVPGLGFRKGIVTLNGVPWDQLAQSDHIEIGFAVVLAGDPKLKLACIPDASLLDEDAQASIAATAEAKGCQVLMEIVSKDDPQSWIIEDGSIVRGPVETDAPQGDQPTLPGVGG